MCAADGEPNEFGCEYDDSLKQRFILCLRKVMLWGR